MGRYAVLMMGQRRISWRNNKTTYHPRPLLFGLYQNTFLQILGNRLLMTARMDVHSHVQCRSLTYSLYPHRCTCALMNQWSMRVHVNNLPVGEICCKFMGTRLASW